MKSLLKKNKKYIAIPPGATLAEQLQDMQITFKDFADRIECSERELKKLINGEIELSEKMSTQLEKLLGVSAQFWKNLEKNYREKLNLINRKKT